MIVATGRTGRGGMSRSVPMRAFLVMSFMALCFSQQQQIDLGNDFPTFFDTYAYAYNNQPQAFIVRCEASQGQTCVQRDLVVECDDVGCPGCISNQGGEATCAEPTDGQNYIAIPDTEVYYANQPGEVGINLESLQISVLTDNGTRPLVKMYVSVLEAPILPVPVSQSVDTQTGDTITITLEAEDEAGLGFEVFVISAPVSGSLTLTNGDAISYGDAIDSREVLYTAGLFVLSDSFAFGATSDPSVVGGGSTGESGTVSITVETSTVQGMTEQIVELAKNSETDFDLELENPDGVSFQIVLQSTPQGDLRTRDASSVNLGTGDTITTGEMVYTAPSLSDQFGSDFFDFIIRSGGSQVSFGSVIFQLFTEGAPETTAFTTININSGEATCISLSNLTADSLTDTTGTFFITALTQEGEIDDRCQTGARAIGFDGEGVVSDRTGGVGRAVLTEPGELDTSSFQIVSSSSDGGSYTTAVEWSVTEVASGLSSINNLIYFRVTDQANSAPVAVATSISVRQASSGLLYLTGYSPVNNPLQAEVVRCPPRATLGALYQTTSGAIIGCDRNGGSGTITVDSDDGTVLYQADTGRPSYTYRFRFLMRDTKTNIASDPIAINIFVEENQSPVAIGGDFTGNEDTLLVIDRSGGSGWGTDPDGDDLRTFISRSPQKGELYQYKENENGIAITSDETKIVVFEPVELTDSFNRVIFSPRLHANGSPYDAFSFVVKDDLNATSNEQRIIVTIRATPDPPTARAILLPNQNEDELFNIALLGDDPDQDDVLSSQITSLPSLGDLYQFDSCKKNVCTNPITAASLQNPVDVINVDQKVWFLPRKDLHGADYFRYRVFDGTHYSGEGSVNITLNNVNDPPVAFNETYSVEFADEVRFTLEVDDIDGADNLVAIIKTLPDGGKLFQVSSAGETESFGDIVQVPTTVTNPDRLLVYRAVGNDIQPSTAYSFTYEGRDEDRATSAPGTITLDVSKDNRESSDGGLSIEIVIGAVIGVVVLVLCAIVFWYRRKRKAKDKERNVFSLLYNNKSSIELLENILVEEDLAVVLALAEQITGPELDDFGEAMVAIFDSHGMVMKVLKDFLLMEIQNTEDSATLFRLNCVSTSLMKYYSKVIGLDYLKSTLGELMDQTLSNVGAYEVDTRKLQEGQDLEENWERLKDATQNYLHAITESVEDCPLEFREIYAFLLKEIEKKFPNCKSAHTFIGGFIFLRFFCPAMIAPEGYRLVGATPTLAERRGLILISKAIQNLSNGVQFGAKEPFMLPMNQFIIENLHRTKRFLEEISTYPQVSEEEIEAVLANRPPVSADRKEDALQAAHRLLCEYQDEVLKVLQDNSEEEAPGDITDPLKDFKALVEMDSDEWEEIGKIIVGDMAIIRAFCRSLQSQEISQALITVFEAHDMTMKILSDLIQGECVEANKNPNMLLRGNGTAFKMFKCYVEIIGLDYLQKTLSMMVKFICNNSEGYEVDPSRCEEGTTEDELKANAERLKEAVNEMWSQIVSSVDQIPIQIRVLCRHLFMQVSDTAPDRAHAVTGDFIFNRMLGPAIVTPMAYGLMDDEPSPSSRRALLLVTKVMMMIVHDVQIADTKEAFLRPLSHLVVDLNDEFRKFIEDVIAVDPKALQNQKFLHTYKVTPALLEDSVKSVFKQMKDDRTKAQMRSLLTPDAREKGTVAERLRNILQDLGPAATRKRVVAPGGATRD